MNAVDTAHPGLRDRFREQVAATLEEVEDQVDGARGYLVEQLWPAAICYAVTAADQFRDRPGGHST
ncbi:hypothetical protein [Streptomyces sp. NPDC059262]|uniref:hypothetical protein n=1 Tax=Streptomyces sp. NPDC059262 TaxID=3346797 RepID=UPI003694C539